MERVRQMNEKMNVLDVQLDNCTAKDAMKIIAEYMQTELDQRSRLKKNMRGYR